MAPDKKLRTGEFGDFQTPAELVSQSLAVLKNLPVQPQSIIEPTCGKGSFLQGAMASFPDAKKVIGVEINAAYLDICRNICSQSSSSSAISLLEANFFAVDWPTLFDKLPEPILILGNPPWVTNTELSNLNSSNLPEKNNFQSWRGLDAITGKSNFDISESILLRCLQCLQNRTGMIAVLCKTAVARKILKYVWQHNYSIESAQIYSIDAYHYFKVTVGACFFVLRVGTGLISKTCQVYSDLEAKSESSTISYHNQTLIANSLIYQKRSGMHGMDPNYTWRSGIKHDCAKVMELERLNQGFVNGHRESVELENTYLYPLLKSSDLGKHQVSQCRKYLLVTQQDMGEDPAQIKAKAPKTWQYLERHAAILARRGSSIYRHRPPFSIFGVGAYSFSPWKVAISGFYKHLVFSIVGPLNDRPVVFDDTVYFLACQSQAEAEFIAGLLNSVLAQDFLSSMIFWDEKRPITIDLLKRLNLYQLACDLGTEQEYRAFTETPPSS